MSGPQVTEAVHIYRFESSRIALGTTTSPVALKTYLSLQGVQVPARSLTILADSGNSDTILVGNSGPAFPLVAGAEITVDYAMVDQVYLSLKAGTAGQLAYVIYGGY
jgi:hypothetical protein